MPNNVGLRRSFSRFGVVRADSGLVLGLAKTFCIGHRGGVFSECTRPCRFSGYARSSRNRFGFSLRPIPDVSARPLADGEHGLSAKSPARCFCGLEFGSPIALEKYICANDCASSPASVSESPIRNRPRSEGRSGGEGCKKALSVGAMRKGGRSRRIFIRLSCIAFCAERRCRRRTGNLN